MFDNSEPQSWPNLVGKNGAEAVEIIKRETGRRFPREIFMNIFIDHFN